MKLDHTGKHLSYWITDDTADRVVSTSILEMPGGKHVGRGQIGWFPGNPFWLRRDGSGAFLDLPAIGRPDRESPALVFGVDSRVTGTVISLDANGSHFVWGTGDGTVHVADFQEILRRMTAAGLEW